MSDKRVSLNILDQVQIAEPCPMPWDSMHGDDRRRFCDACGKHVHHLSAMSHADAESLVSGAIDRMCIRVTRNAEGGVRTRDEAPRRRWLARIAAAVAASLGLSLAGCDDGGACTAPNRLWPFARQRSVTTWGMMVLPPLPAPPPAGAAIPPPQSQGPVDQHMDDAALDPEPAGPVARPTAPD